MGSLGRGEVMRRVAFYSVHLSLSISIISTITFISLVCIASPKPIEVSNPLSCRQAVQKYLAHHLTILNTRQRLLSQRFETLEKMRWMPKEPQLRGRFDQEQKADLSQSRIGLRWHMPHFTGAEDVLARYELNQLDLIELWIDLHKSAIATRISKTHINYRIAWVNWSTLTVKALIKSTQVSLVQDLVSIGMNPTEKLIIHQTELQKLRQKIQIQRRVLNAISSTLNLNRTTQPQLDLQHSPLSYRCQTIPATTHGWNELLSLKVRRTLEEVEAIINLQLSTLKDHKDSYQWLDFMELSYDGTDGAERLIAEVGVNLPFGSYRSKESEIQRLGEKQDIRLLEKQSLEHRNALKEVLKIDQLQLNDDVQVSPPMRKDITSLQDLNLWNAQLQLWQTQWLNRLSLEEAIIDWHSLNYTQPMTQTE